MLLLMLIVLVVVIVLAVATRRAAPSAEPSGPEPGAGVGRGGRADASRAAHEQPSRAELVRRRPYEKLRGPPARPLGPAPSPGACDVTFRLTAADAVTSAFSDA